MKLSGIVVVRKGEVCGDHEGDGKQRLREGGHKDGGRAVAVGCHNGELSDYDIIIYTSTT